MKKLLLITALFLIQLNTLNILKANEWHDILGVAEDASIEIINKAFLEQKLDLKIEIEELKNKHCRNIGAQQRQQKNLGYYTESLGALYKTYDMITKNMEHKGWRTIFGFEKDASIENIDQAFTTLNQKIKKKKSKFKNSSYSGKKQLETDLWFLEELLNNLKNLYHERTKKEEHQEDIFEFEMN